MKKVLIVDDQSELRKLLDLVLRPEGYCLGWAATGEEAVRAARAMRPDLILLDVLLPGKLDGLDVVRILKSDPATSACPVLIMTAQVREGDRDEAIASGADGYIRKPFDLVELQEKVKRLMEERTIVPGELLTTFRKVLGDAPP